MPPMEKRYSMNDKTVSFLDMHRRYWPETYDAQMLPLRISLFHAQMAHHAHATEVVTANGLSLVEFDVLASLRRSPPPHALTPSEIQRSMLITSGGLTKVLTQLETRGLVTRSTQDTDRRVKPVALARQALPILDKVMAELHAAVDSWINRCLNGAEIAQLTTLLAKLADTGSPRD